MVAHLSNDFEFWIVTRDRDLNSTAPYPSISIDEWNMVDQAKVFYASPITFSFIGILRLLRSTQYDVLYLNSFFSSTTTMQPLLIRYLGLSRPTPVVLAPRGEFSVGALALKSTKKSFYLASIKWVKLYKGLFWQASSKYEVEDIYRTIPFLKESKSIINAPDLLPIALKPAGGCSADYKNKKVRMPGPLRVVFLSRISPMKNLDYLLRALNKVNNPVDLSIYGPDEDAPYWALCQDLIKDLPAHVSVTYHGEVIYENVAHTFSEQDLFVFPTRGENFGHVIYEALSVGTSVIVSDQTPWQADSDGALQVLALEQPEAWTAAINKWAAFDDQAYATMRAATYNYAANYAATSGAVEKNRNLFRIALSSPQELFP